MFYYFSHILIISSEIPSQFFKTKSWRFLYFIYFVCCLYLYCIWLHNLCIPSYYKLDLYPCCNTVNSMNAIRNASIPTGSYSATLSSQTRLDHWNHNTCRYFNLPKYKFVYSMFIERKMIVFDNNATYNQYCNHTSISTGAL